MLSLANSLDREFVWTREHEPERYVLRSRSGNGPYAVLTRESGSVITGTSAEGSWTFRRSGFLGVRVQSRSEGWEKDFAVLNFTGRGEGMLEMCTGVLWSWMCRAFWRQEHEFIHHEREPAMKVFNDATGKFLVRIAEAGRSLAEMPVMVMLTAYLGLMITDDAPPGNSANRFQG